MSQKESQHEEESVTIYDMMDEILVVCPRCLSCARITPTRGRATPHYSRLITYREAVSDEMNCCSR